MPTRSILRLALTTVAVLLLPASASAQATLTAEAGLASLYKAGEWTPLQILLTNQGAPARVEVRARFATGEGRQEWRLPERTLQSSARELHTLALKAPESHASQQLIVDLYRDGRLIQTLRPQLRALDAPDALVVGIGPGQFTASLALMGSLQVASRNRGIGRKGFVHVAPLDPPRLPDRWQTLSPADLVVLGQSTDRDFTPEQLAALKDYVAAGGTLVVTGGVNWVRLQAPFFRELLPVRVTGPGTATGIPTGRLSTPALANGTEFAVCEGELLPGAEVLVGGSVRPLVAAREFGAGRVVFMAFDPSLAPFNTWPGTQALWGALIAYPRRGLLIEALGQTDWRSTGTYGPGDAKRLVDAPFSIPQLDIPSFYLVALFLLAYIVVLVPVNYFVLRARDRREYAWITTPVIVLLFSFGAYLLGYGLKGGRTLLVNAAVVEAHSGRDSAPFLQYAALFSPQKTGYDLQLVADSPSEQAVAGSALFSDPGLDETRRPFQVIQGDAVATVKDFAVDMWAMRATRMDGMLRLDRGISARVTRQGDLARGSVTNQTPFDLEDCSVVYQGATQMVGRLPRGGSADFRLQRGPGLESGLLAALLMPPGPQSPNAESRLRREVMAAALGHRFDVGGLKPPDHPLLVGWIPGPVARIRVDGRNAREQSATLLVVHLDQ